MSDTGQGFRASLFAPALGNEVVEGKIFVDRWKLRFVSETVTHEIRADDLEAEWEPSEGRIYLRDFTNPDLSIYTLDQSILTRPALPQLEELKAEIGNAKGRQEFSRRMRITLYFFIGCIFVAWGISWATGAMVRSIAKKIPPEWEKSIGEASLKEWEGKMSSPEYSNQVVQLTALAAPLLQVIPHQGTDVKFYIVDDSEPNAFALPGGYVVVNTGLLRLTDRPEEIQGVLAHELAHVTQKHLVRKIIAASGPVVIFGLFFHSNDGLMNILMGGSGLVVFQSFSKEFETEADEVGWQYLVSAKINPRGMIDMFRKFQVWEKTGNNQAGIALPQALSSHPLLEKRIARLEGHWRKLRNKTGFLVQTNPVPTVPPN